MNKMYIERANFCTETYHKVATDEIEGQRGMMRLLTGLRRLPWTRRGAKMGCDSCLWSSTAGQSSELLESMSSKRYSLTCSVQLGS